jgi:hypothetical protein
MVEVASKDVVGVLATVSSLLANCVWVRDRSLVISRASTSRCFKAWRGRATGETRALVQVCLRRLHAVKAALLAPTKEASCFAILGSEVTRHSKALAASCRDANCGCQATIELVMVEVASNDVVSALATVSSLLANGIRIRNGSLIICRASTSGRCFEAGSG